MERICYDMQEFINLTRYNLKKCYDDKKPSVLTFVCSCISKKKTKSLKKIYNDGFDSSPETRRESFDINLTSKKILKRNVKRHNEAPCHFRIKFKKNKKSSSISLKKNANFAHNHEPESKTLEVINFQNKFNSFYLFF